MNQRIEIRCVLSLRHTFVGRIENKFAVVRLSREWLDYCLERMFRAVRKNLSFSEEDSAITIYQKTKKWLSGHDPAEFRNKIDDLLEEGLYERFGKYVGATISMNGAKVRKHRMIIKIFPYCVLWEEDRARSFNGGIATDMITLDNLLLARLYYATSQQEMDYFFGKLMVEFPARALDALEHGIDIIGHGKVQIFPSQHALLPALAHSDKEVRLRAITALEKLRKTRTELTLA